MKAPQESIKNVLQPDGGWQAAASQRLFPPPPQQRGWLFRLLSIAARAFGRTQVPELFPVLHIHRGLFWPWLLFASRLMPRGRLHPHDREKIILRTAWNCRSRYEWAQHVDIALSAGMTDQDIARIAQGPCACLDADERVLLSACDELQQYRCISQDTWHRLSRRYDPARLIEITLLAGHYAMLAGFLNSTGLQLEPPLARRLDDLHDRLAQTLRV